jgi:hypothetical protein
MLSKIKQTITIRPASLIGTISPYPTVVKVFYASQGEFCCFEAELKKILRLCKGYNHHVIQTIVEIIKWILCS